VSNITPNQRHAIEEPVRADLAPGQRIITTLAALLDRLGGDNTIQGIDAFCCLVKTNKVQSLLECLIS
jgi:hypothetical protein